MKKLLTILLSFVLVDTDAVRRKREYEYLSKATDLCDLERRQRKLMNPNLRGWV